jgi:hypothetical protein
MPVTRIAFREQLRRHPHNDLGGSEVGAPQVDESFRQQVLHISPLAISGCQPMHGEVLAQVVEARPVACAVVTPNNSVLAEATKSVFYRSLDHACHVVSCEEEDPWSYKTD